MTYSTPAIVLRREPRGEYDRIYTLYTERLGKVEVVATGSRRIKSKLAPHLETPGIVEVFLARGARYERLANAILGERFMTDPFSALWCGELVDVLTETHAPERLIFELLCETFRSPQLVVRRDQFTWELLHRMGYCAHPWRDGAGEHLLEEALAHATPASPWKETRLKRLWFHGGNEQVRV